MSRRQRHFGEPDRQALLKAIERCRDACVEAQRRSDFHSDVYKRVTALQGAIDHVAELLTGDREHFWLKMKMADTPSK